jgi:hypothetical protein
MNISTIVIIKKMWEKITTGKVYAILERFKMYVGSTEKGD